MNIVPTIAGSNRDEVKLWLGTARYFVDLDYSFNWLYFEYTKGILKMKIHLKLLIIIEVQHGK